MIPPETSARRLAFRWYRCAQPTATNGLSPCGERGRELSDFRFQFSDLSFQFSDGALGALTTLRSLGKRVGDSRTGGIESSGSRERPGRRCCVPAA